MSLLIRIVVFYVLTFVFTVVLGGLQETTGFAAGSLILPQWGPGLAAVLMLLIFHRDELRLSLSLRAAPPRRLIAALLLPVGVGAALFAILRPELTAPAAPLWLLIPGMALGAFGEELGWRAYLHKRIDRQMRPLASSALVGVLWALWHVGFYQNGVAYMALLVVLMIAYSIVIYRLAAAGFNLWIAAAFHLGINLGNLLLLSVINDVSFIAANALVWALLAIGLIAARRDVFLRRPAGDAYAIRPDAPAVDGALN